MASTVNPPNKPPPLPPRSPPRLAPPVPPPPPPPKNQSQLLSSNSNFGSKNNCGGGLLNNGSSINSLNSVGSRYSHAHSVGNGSAMTLTHGSQRCFSRHGETVSSRSSLTSHVSLPHHHPTTGFGCGGNGNIGCRGQLCSHQICNCATAQHDHANSSSMSDNGSFHHDNRSFIPAPYTGCNCHQHMHGSMPKCQTQTSNLQTTSARNNCANESHNPSITNRNIPFYNGDSIGSDPMSSSCLSDSGHCSGTFPHMTNHPDHHHHHHHHHATTSGQVSVHSSMSSLQPVDSNSSQFNRCASQSSTANSALSAPGDSVSRTSVNNHHGHVHRVNVCGHHHQTSCCGHHGPVTASHQPCACNGCSHSHAHNGHLAHHSCNSSLVGGSGKVYSTCSEHHYSPELIAGQSTDNAHTDPLIPTAHTHNLSNSSTTTHTSNVAVRHQPQFHRPLPSRLGGGRSNSSQQYEHYGLSSATSTSSANASLSSYQTHGCYEDALQSCNMASKMNQPLPQPPTAKSRPQSPVNRGQNPVNTSQQNVYPGSYLGSPYNKSLPKPPSNFNNNAGNQHNQQGNSTIQQFNGNTSLPPLPPRPNSPTSNSNRLASTHSESLQTNRFQNSSIVAQNQNYNSQNDPPPLPPINSKPQPPPNWNKINQVNATDQNNILIPEFINLNIGSRNGHMTEAERKTEELTRQVELELEKKQKSGEPRGLCPKCGTKVLPSQAACKAMNQDKVYCEEDYKYTGHLQSLEKCAACSEPIFNMILPAMGKSYHPKCFKCSVCSQCLDGVPFTIDRENRIYCVKDYHSIYSPKCAACGKTISPIDGTGETVRVVSMDKDYHIDCYCCEDCGLQLTDEKPSQSYPLGNHLLCQQCHINRRNKMSAALNAVDCVPSE